MTSTRRSALTAPRTAPVLATAALTAIALVTGVLLAVPRAAAAPDAGSKAASKATRAAAPSAAKSRAAAIVKQRKRALKVLDRVNAARRQGVCGYPPAKPLKYRADLATAARRHARDMARKNYFDHDSRSGSSPSQRARAAGYRGGTGENIAAGYGSVARTMRAWLNSPGHCANIMSRSYKHLGIGYAYNASSDYRDYWVQDFGTG